jgi:hypothetical protein
MPQILPPSLPPIIEGNLPIDKWVCDKCDAEQSVNKMRGGACKSWRGGKRGALKKSESTKKDHQHTVNCGRKPKQTQPAATVPVDCSNLFISSEDALSPLTAGPNVNDESIEESTIDWENDHIDTVTHESNDECIKLLQAEDDINNIGDGGTSDGKGEGYDCVHSFQDGMKEVEREHLDHDTDEIEHCVEVDDDDAIICDEPNMVPSALPGAPNGWSPPSPPNNWNSTVNSLKREPPFDEVDNPGCWSSFTYRPLFQPKGGYMFHTMPAGVPLLFLLIK